MQIEVTISLKNGILDPQAKAIHNAIVSLGLNNVSKVILKKQIILEFEDNDKDTIMQQTEMIAKDLLSKPVIEEYKIQIKD